MDGEQAPAATDLVELVDVESELDDESEFDDSEDDYSDLGQATTRRQPRETNRYQSVGVSTTAGGASLLRLVAGRRSGAASATTQRKRRASKPREQYRTSWTGMPLLKLSAAAAICASLSHKCVQTNRAASASATTSAASVIFLSFHWALVPSSSCMRACVCACVCVCVCACACVCV